jgi:hypothetical protein
MNPPQPPKDCPPGFYYDEGIDDCVKAGSTSSSGGPGIAVDQPVDDADADTSWTRKISGE